MDWHLMEGITVIGHLLLAVLFLFAFITDIKTMTIPNRLTVPGMVLGILFHAATQQWYGLRFALVGCLLGLGILFPLYAIGALGGGDVKMFGAVGAIGGTEFVFYCIFYSILFAGLEALIILSVKKFKRKAAGSPNRQGPLEFPFMVAAVPGAVTAYMGLYL